MSKSIYREPHIVNYRMMDHKILQSQIEEYKKKDRMRCKSNNIRSILYEPDEAEAKIQARNKNGYEKYQFKFIKKSTARGVSGYKNKYIQLAKHNLYDWGKMNNLPVKQKMNYFELVNLIYKNL